MLSFNSEALSKICIGEDMKNVKSFEEAAKLWSIVVGEFIIEFTQIEQLLHLVIAKYLTQTLIKNEHLTESFEKRIKLFKEIMQSKLAENDFVELDKLCQTVMRLKNTRNLIAHNSLVLEVEQNSDGELRISEYVVASLINKNKAIRFKKLQSEVANLKSTVKQMSDIVVRSTNSAF